MAFAPAGSLIDVLSPSLPEVISKSIDYLLPQTSSIWKKSVVNSMGVVPVDEIGKDFKIIRTFYGSLTGVIEQGKPRGDFPLYGDQTTNISPKMFLQAGVQVWPSGAEGPNARRYRLGIPMRSMLGNIRWSLGELTADANPNLVGQVVAPKMMGLVRNWVKMLCTYFYLSQNDSYKLATVDGDASLTSVSSSTLSGDSIFLITVTPREDSTVRFATGDRVDFYNSAGTTRRNVLDGTRVPVWVHAVDHGLNRVIFATTVHPTDWTWGDSSSSQGTSAGSSIADNIADGDIIVYANSKDTGGSAPFFTGVAGINSWLKGGAGGNDNILLGAEADSTDQIDVTVHPEFKSFTKAVGGSLSETLLQQYLSRHDAMQGIYGSMGSQIDTLVASDGVWQDYLDQKSNLFRLVPGHGGDKLASTTYEGDDPEAFYIPFKGRRLAAFTDRYVETGVVYGLQLGGGNIEKVVPPKLKGAIQGSSEPGVPFEFVAPALTGTNSKQFPVLNVSGSAARLTEEYEMPHWLRMQIIIKRPSAMKLTGISEARQYSDA